MTEKRESRWKAIAKQSDLIEQTVEEIVRNRKPKTVAELFQILHEARPDITQATLASTVKKMKEEGRIELELPTPELPPAPSNTWLYFVTAASISALMAVYVIPSTYPIVVFRWIIGSIFVLFLPGYVTVQALFPTGRGLDSIERFALSVGLSLAIAPLIGLALNYTPWGVRLDPIMVSLSLFTLAVAAAAAYRRRKAASIGGSSGSEQQ